MSRQTFAGVDLRDAPPGSHSAVANTITRTNLWSPSLWSPIPAIDMRPGKVYQVRAGGIISTTGTPTLILNPTVGQSATPASNVTLGASNAVTLGTITNASWYAEFFVAVRALGMAAAGSTVTGNGFVVVNGAAGATAQLIAVGGSVPTNVDDTVASGVCLDVTWGTASPSNSITAQWTLLQSLN
jgi:hypothetical protein